MPNKNLKITVSQGNEVVIEVTSASFRADWGKVDAEELRVLWRQINKMMMIQSSKKGGGVC